VCFAARRKPHVGKLALVRTLTGGLSVGARLGGGAVGALLRPGDAKAAAADASAAGAVAAAGKAEHIAPLTLLTAEGARPAPDWSRPPAPMAPQTVAAASTKDDAKLSAALAALVEDDPLLALAADIEAGARVLWTQGPLHERAVIEALANHHGVAVEIAAAPVSYRETIVKPVEMRHRHRKQSGGAGQFADVAVTVAPAGRGEGFVFTETVKGGVVPRTYIPAVEAGAREALGKGPLGFSVVDVAVTLTDGKAHAVDSSDHAFRAAGRGAVAEALAEAGPVLLQPIHLVTFHVPTIYAGGLSPLVSQMKGQVLGFERDPEARGWDVFRALMPGSALPDLAGALRGATQGVGRFEHAFDHFEEIYGKEAQAVVAAHAAA
jgi:elongation factor G